MERIRPLAFASSAAPIVERLWERAAQSEKNSEKYDVAERESAF